MVLALLTLGHAGYRVASARSARPAAVHVSKLRAGDTAPDLPIRIVTASMDSTGSLSGPAGRCRIVVAYESSCPYSVQAAEREAARTEEELTLPIMWITGDSGEAARAFRSSVRGSSVVAYGPTVFEVLRVQAVPAAFLLGVDGEVLRSWRYRGDEAHDELRVACGEPEGG